jgi:hypothetical protein
VALVRKRTIPTERPPLVGEVLPFPNACSHSAPSRFDYIERNTAALILYVYIVLLWGLCNLLRVLSRVVSKTVLRNKHTRCFYLYSLSQHVSAYLMAILRRIVELVKRSYHFYNGSVVFSIIMCVSCRQLIAVVYIVPEYVTVRRLF